MIHNDFSYQDWNGCDRKNQDLSYHIFIGTKINGSDLRGCVLNGSKLQNAQLCGTDLRNASLRGANLCNANLNGADLREAIFTGADLSHANLQNTRLNGVDFNGANVQSALLAGSSGLTKEVKESLKNRGAIFSDSLTTTNIKWWIQYVLIPLSAITIGSGGIIGFIDYVKKQSSTTSTPSPKLQYVNPAFSSPKNESTTASQTPSDSKKK
jgi:uncharacterized protein YjbI with pentapeptide repeats